MMPKTQFTIHIGLSPEAQERVAAYQSRPKGYVGSIELEVGMTVLIDRLLRSELGFPQLDDDNDIGEDSLMSVHYSYE